MWEAKGFEVIPGLYDKSHEGGRSREHRGETQEPLGQLGSQEVGGVSGSAVESERLTGSWPEWGRVGFRQSEEYMESLTRLTLLESACRPLAWPG